MSDVQDAALADRLAGLTPAQRAFVEQRLRQVADAGHAGAIPRRAGDGAAPLSFAQELLWNIEQTAPGESTYNVPRAMRIAGPLDEARLQAALDALVSRHETLRTVYAVRDAQPVQIVREARPVHVRRIDVREIPSNERDAALARIIGDAAGEPFDLTADPLLRATLVRAGDDEHVLVLVSHHLASDDASASILFGELARGYGAAAPAVPDPAVRYTDFAAWQRDWWRGERLDALLDHWHERLRGAPEYLDLPFDRPRPALPTFAGARRGITFPRTLADGIATLAKSQGTTPFVTLLAAFQTLLHRYTRADDVLVGSVFSGRARAELDGVLGYFSNVLPLRARFADDRPFDAVLAAAHESYLDAAEHADVPFDRLVLELTDRGATDVPRSFQVLFSMAAGGPSVPVLGALQVEPLPVDRRVARVDLSITAALMADGLRVDAEYRTQLFDDSTIERMLANFGVLLEGIVADPGGAVSRLPLLGAAERALFARDRHAADAPFRRDATVHALVAEQAARTPDAIALEAEDAGGMPVRVSYRELERRAAALAAYLGSLGAGPGVGVAVATDRAYEAVVALLGVLKSGAYYVPIDPEYPSERVRFMLRDANVPVLLTLERLGLPAASDAAAAVRVVYLDTHWDAIERAGAAPATIASTADDLAYVIYTSGSTGTPKGVMVPHRALVNFLSSMAREPGLSARDTVLAVTTFAFDIAGLEVWLPLIVGARLVLAPRATAIDGHKLAERIAGARATLLQATPATWRLLLAAGWSGSPELTMLCGGEALPPDLAAALIPRGKALWNMYGPTEATVWSSLARVRADAPISLGNPIANTELYVLEKSGSPAPLGVAGELWIGGAGVAAGYLGRDALTAERFVADPFRRDGTRMYRTGDCVRRHGDGRLEFLGRLDAQVKLRGFRVELGEIEAALAAIPGVAQAVAAIREDVPGEPRLIAYVAGDAAADDAALRSALRASLPSYMIPSAFVPLTAFPLTPNGKIDRAALPPPAPSSARSRTAVPPQTPEEKAILEMFAAVLRCADAGIDDDFFDLGGHSLLAMRLLDRVAASYGVRLTLREFFADPRPRALASRVSGAAPPAAAANGVRPARASGATPLLWSQDVLLTLQRGMGDAAAYNMRVWRRITGALDVAALRHALDGLVQRHEALRTLFTEADGEPRAYAADPSPVPLAEVDLSGFAGPGQAAEAERRLRSFGLLPFDLSRDPLLRAMVVTLSETEHLLGLVSHHIVTDGPSIGIMLRDLSALYEAAAGNSPAEPPAPAATFADYVVRERQRADARSAELSAYWRRELEGSTPTLPLPVDRPGSRAPVFAGAHSVSFVPATLLEDLRRLARRQNTTPFVVLAAAYATLLHRYTAQDDVVIGTPADGRDTPELADVVGFFVSTLPLRVRFAGDPTFAAVLAQVTDTAFSAYEHRPVPPAGSGEPLFETLFTFAPADDVPRLGALAASTFAVETATAKMPLALAIGEWNDGLRISFEYRTDMFDADTVRRIASHFGTLLESVVADPARAVSRLPILSADERRALLVTWNGAKVPYPRDASIAAVFAERAAASAHAVALVDGTRSVTYRELDERANRLAHRLQSLGVDRDVPVGLCGSRSIETVVGALGILKAGGAYVPLDPAYPAERLRLMVDDTALSVVVTTAAFADVLPQVAHVVRLDLDAGSLAAESPLAPACRADAESAAYIVYTSGSTGVPKGVTATQRGVLRLVCGARYAHFGPDDVVLGFAPLTFDASTFEIWGALLNGGRIALFDNETPSLQDIGDAVREHGVTTLWLTAALFHQMLDTDIEALRGLRQLLAGGDVLSVPHVRRALAELPQCRLINGYGPTENTTFTTCFDVPRDWNADGSATAVPIGRPIENTSVYLLDAASELVPIGVAGRLYAGGDGVARGYHNRPELTAERFVRDPFSEVAGARMYDTGDRARWRADGTIEFLGRADRQLKIRGFRVEPGEIEAALADHPGVLEAVVVGRADPSRGADLVGYVVPRPGTDLQVHDLRNFLAARLPAYLVPSVFVPLDALPLTPSGKVDRDALPVPSSSAIRAGGTSFAGPRDAAESAVAGLFAELLPTKSEIGIDDDFFELGGHSLLVMRLVARVSKTFRVTLSVRSFFDSPTVRGAVRTLRASEPSHGHIDAVAGSLRAAQPAAPAARDETVSP